MKRDESYPLNHGATWSKAHLEELQEGFKKGLSVKELAQQCQRTEGAIASKLEALGLLINVWGSYHKVEKEVYYFSGWSKAPAINCK